MSKLFASLSMAVALTTFSCNPPPADPAGRQPPPPPGAAVVGAQLAFFHPDLGVHAHVPPALIDEPSDKRAYVAWFADEWPEVAKGISAALDAPGWDRHVYVGLVAGSGCMAPLFIGLRRDGDDWFAWPQGGHVDGVACEAPVKGVAVYRVPKAIVPDDLRLDGEKPADKVQPPRE